MKPLTYTRSEWFKIWEKIKQNNPPSVYLVREKMRKKLGFTHREHTEWEPSMVRYKVMIHLDFYDERYRSLFLLRYGSDPVSEGDALEVYDC